MYVTETEFVLFFRPYYFHTVNSKLSYFHSSRLLSIVAARWRVIPLLLDFMILLVKVKWSSKTRSVLVHACHLVEKNMYYTVNLKNYTYNLLIISCLYIYNCFIHNMSENKYGSQETWGSAHGHQIRLFLLLQKRWGVLLNQRSIRIDYKPIYSAGLSLLFFSC